DLALEQDPEFDTLMTPPAGNPTTIARVIRSVRALLWEPQRAAASSAEERQAITEQNVRRRLSVTNDGRSYTIVLRFTSSDRDKAASVANAIAGSYLETELSARAGLLNRVSQLLDEKSASLRDRMIQTETAVAAYKKLNGIVLIGKDQSLVSDGLAKLNTELASASSRS